MANRQLFQSAGRAALIPDTKNKAGGAAYSMPPKHALAQYAATGTFADGFYETGADQLKTVLDLVGKVPAEFAAKCAVWTRKNSHMKDMPAFICAALTSIDKDLARKAFSQTIDNGKMLRNFVQILRSGATGRKSLGTAPKRLVLDWLAGKTPNYIFEQSVGNDPSLADVIKMVHPKPSTDEQRALFAYLIGREYNADHLPPKVKAFEAFKRGDTKEVPKLPHEMLTALPLTAEQWAEIARFSGWHMIRMNLNTFQRQGVFAIPGMDQVIADKLADAEAIAKARAFPYQLMAAYQNVGDDVPRKVKDALHDAMELATKNTPDFGCGVLVFPDVSGSMSSPVTGQRGSATTKMRCIHVAGLFASCVLRRNPDAKVIPFEGQPVPVKLEPRDTVMTNAAKLASIGGGSTNCAAPLYLCNHMGWNADLVVYVSDNESWVNSGGYYGAQRTTQVMAEWNKFKGRNPKAKMVCIDIQANGTTQAKESKDILNIGGFSDAIFSTIENFVRDRGADHWVDEIEKVEL